MLLDDAKAIREIDRSNMLSLMERTPVRLAPPADAPRTCPGKFGTFENLVLGGVGGSGIVGEILSDCCRDSADVPFVVCRTLRIPKFIGKRTLFIAISYSGETQETLGQLEQARRKGAKVIAITSGGKLLSQAKRREMPHVRVAPGLLPRLALPELLAAAVFVAGSAGVLRDASEHLSKTARSLRNLIKKIELTVPSQYNDAKQMAQSLVNKLPLLIGDEAQGSVLRRFKNELNENSKVPAFYYTLPEGYHDDIEGLEVLRQLANPQPILFRTPKQADGQGRTLKQLVGLLSELGFPPVLEFEGRGESAFSQLLTAITFADYVSVYLAILRGVDPAELRFIPKFREAMRGS